MARRLQESTTIAPQENLLQLVTFVLGNDEFGVDILTVREIMHMLPITRVPNAPDFVEGVINLRGKILPIIDLRKRFGYPAREYDKRTRIIVMEIRNKIIGLIVDAVLEILRIPAHVTEKPPCVVAGIQRNYITSVAKLDSKLLILLDLSQALSNSETDLLEA